MGKNKKKWYSPESLQDPNTTKKQKKKVAKHLREHNQASQEGQQQPEEYGGFKDKASYEAWKNGSGSLMEAMPKAQVKMMRHQNMSETCRLRKYWHRVENKLREIARDKRIPYNLKDTTNFILPENVTTVLGVIQVDWLTEEVRKKMARGGPDPESPEEEKDILANADILPVEAARSVSLKIRKKLVATLIGQRRKSESQSYPTVPYKGDDEEFIQGNLTLVPRKLAEFLTKEDRRQLVELVKSCPLMIKGRVTLFETLKEEHAILLFSEGTRKLFPKGIRYELDSDPAMDAQFFSTTEKNDGCFKMVPKEVFNELGIQKRRDVAKKVKECTNLDELKAKTSSRHIEETADVLPIEAVVFLHHDDRSWVAERIRKRRMVAAAAQGSFDETLMPVWLAGLLTQEEKSELSEKLQKLADLHGEERRLKVEELVASSAKETTEEVQPKKRKHDGQDDGDEVKEKHKKSNHDEADEKKTFEKGECFIGNLEAWKSGNCSLLETMHHAELKNLLTRQSSSTSIKPIYLERIWYKLTEIRRDKNDTTNFVMPEKLSSVLELKLVNRLTAQVRTEIAKGGPFPVDDPEEEKAILANADVLPVQVARVLGAQERQELVRKITALKELSELRSYPTVSYQGDDEAFITENVTLVPRKLAEFLTKEDRRELVILVKNCPQVLKTSRSFIETLPQEDSLKLFSEETRQLFRNSVKKESNSDPALDPMFFKESEEIGYFKVVPKEVFCELELHDRRELVKEIKRFPDPEKKKAIVMECKARKKKDGFYIDECQDVIPLLGLAFLNHKHRLLVAKRIRKRRKVAGTKGFFDKSLLPAWIAGLLMPVEKAEMMDKLKKLKEGRE